jgi:AraC-like DNA-binding protein/quercetin dioxygenase-like cupin family protein
METDQPFLVRSLAVTYGNGHRIGAHAHAWAQLVYARAGTMRLVTPTAAWLVPPTRAIWLPPGLVHEIEMRGAVSMRTLYLAPDLVHEASKEARALEVAPLLRELVLHILKIGLLVRVRPDHARLAGLLMDLLDAAREQDLSAPLPSDPRALALAHRLLEAPDERAALAMLAPRAGASLRTMQRLFLDQTGLSLQAWRQKSRLIHAVAALGEGVPVTVAALDCGYDSPSAFITVFRRQFGVTPGRYGRDP